MHEINLTEKLAGPVFRGKYRNCKHLGEAEKTGQLKFKEEKSKKLFEIFNVIEDLLSALNEDDKASPEELDLILTLINKSTGNIIIQKQLSSYLANINLKNQKLGTVLKELADKVNEYRDDINLQHLIEHALYMKTIKSTKQNKNSKRKSIK